LTFELPTLAMTAEETRAAVALTAVNQTPRSL
jgi:hypothetical protein